jgi:hypothetical protein
MKHLLKFLLIISIFALLICVFKLYVHQNNVKKEVEKYMNDYRTKLK